jgi:NAD(P)-dependent dehydrogenase (short-subunit alcohol dehydrogenase family)
MIKNGGGAIISIATGVAVDAHAGGHSQHQYAISKAGVVMMSRLIAGTYGTKGIRSNIIAPGATNSWVTPTLKEYAAATSPAGRLGTVEEVAALALFLASDVGSYINGEEIRLNGGTHVWSRDYKTLAKL